MFKDKLALKKKAAAIAAKKEDYQNYSQHGEKGLNVLRKEIGSFYSLSSVAISITNR